MIRNGLQWQIVAASLKAVVVLGIAQRFRTPWSPFGSEINWSKKIWREAM
jgi:hypothetical protein